MRMGWYEGRPVFCLSCSPASGQSLETTSGSALSTRRAAPSAPRCGPFSHFQALGEELALHAPGPVHAAAAIDQRDVSAGPLEEIAPPVAEVLHPVVAGDGIRA